MADYRRRLEELDDRARRRTLRSLQSAQGARVVLDGRPLVCFSSNDYLGLANHPAVIVAARQALETRGHGAGAARLLAGNFDLYERLETELADWLGREAAVVFGSGYLANIGTLSSLPVAGERLYSDQLNHASLIDGCRLSRAAVEVYPHLACPPAGAGDWIVTESVFSMDGDSPDFARLASRDGARLVVDEAHALGVVGDGRGLSSGAHLIVGTLGKALGSYGAFVAGDRDVIELLLNTARSFIFTTALPAPTLAAARAAVELARGPEGVARRDHLRGLCELLASGLESLGWPADPRAPIFPIVAGAEDAALRLARTLEDAGLLVQAIRPPTVPPETSRLRIVLSAEHQRADVERLLDALESAKGITTL